jgi:hypothetical protein
VLIGTRKTNAYGLWVAIVRTPDGRQVEAWGHGEQAAIYRAYVRAEEQEHG